MNFQMNEIETETADFIRAEFGEITMSAEFRPRASTRRKRTALISLPLGAAIAAAVAITAYNPLVPPSPSWATEPVEVSTLTAAEANTLCASRAMQVIPPQMLSKTLAENVQWLENFNVLIDERGQHALSFYDKDGGDYSVACILTRTADKWSADFFAARSHHGKKHVQWAELVELSSGKRVSFLAGWKPADSSVEITFDGSTGSATTDHNYYAIWMPATATCSPVKLTETLGDQTNSSIVEFGGTDGFSTDEGICTPTSSE